MKRIVWSTDIHLNFAAPQVLMEYLECLSDASPDALLLGGDIAESQNLVDYLVLLDEHVSCPIYFVLGNHDYYYGSIEQVRQAVSELCRQRPKLFYLTEGSVVELSPSVGLVGHDGWADGRIGDYERSMVMMNDYRLIEELSGFGKRQRWAVLKQLGDAAAAAIRHTLPRALDRYQQVVLLTHVPPVREACWYNGRISDDEWICHFTCKAVGDSLLEIARRYTHRELTVLCGHTHSAGTCHPLKHLTILTGGAEYGFPAINEVLFLPGSKAST
jgi:predicted phosphohydrolase